MKISIGLTNFTQPTGPAGLRTYLRDVAITADDAGIDTVWVADHLLQLDPWSQQDTEMLEAYTTLGFLAAHTERVRLGTMVTAVTFRAPALLIKQVTTLDVLTGGRMWFGLGAGYLTKEAAAMGLALPPTGERFERLEETLRLALRMWSGDATQFHGTHYRLDNPVNSPNSLRRPHPPILIGGAGEQRTLPLVARYADACNLFDIPDGGKTLRHKLSVLAEHCAAVGRPFGEIEKTVSTAIEPGESAESFADRCAALAALGAEHIAVIARGGAWTEQTLGAVTAAVPRVRDLAAA